jgi:small neutral amino acid transporter SnatA (MarC family)
MVPALDKYSLNSQNEQSATCWPINQPSSASPRRLLTFVVWSAGLENQRLAGISDAQEITVLTCLTALTAYVR